MDGVLRIRVPQDCLDKFQEKSKMIMGKPYQALIREMITAFNEGRLRITPTEEQKQQLRGLYDVD
jgi:hypothetical protein